MKKWLKFSPALVICALLIWAIRASGQSTQPQMMCNAVINVTSATVPTVLATPGNISTYVFENSVTPGTDPVVIFPYQGTPPTAIPTPEADMEIPSGTTFVDSVTCDSPNCRQGMGAGWMVALEGGSTATKVRSCTR